MDHIVTTPTSKKNKIIQILVTVVPHTIPVLVALLFLGTTYGILMASKGYGPLWSVLMSAIAFCGSMQFVAITLLTAPFAPIAAFFMALMVNARHLFYGISMLEKYRGIKRSKPFLIYTLCDENFSINYSAKIPEGMSKDLFYTVVSLLNYSYWIIGSLIGGLIGNMITFNTKGLDFALTALFVVIFIDQWRDTKNRVSGMIGIICSILGIVLFGTKQFIVPTMIIILILLTLLRKKLEGVHEHDTNK